MMSQFVAAGLDDCRPFQLNLGPKKPQRAARGVAAGRWGDESRGTSS